MIQFAHINHTGNLGDLTCCPASYVDIGKPAEIIDIRTYDRGDVVFGGGGLLHPGLDGILAKAVADTKHDAKKVIWGIGTNYHENTSELQYPEFLSQFTLVGMRDKPSVHGFEFVPCASCLHPAFDLPHPAPIFDAVIYAHSAMPIPIRHFPVLTNNQFPPSFKSTQDFLATGDVVITNSYHGAYWAALLGRKVVVWQPCSSRFHFFDFPVTFCNDEDFKTAMKNAVFWHDGLLAQYRHLNRVFADKVREVFK